MPKREEFVRRILRSLKQAGDSRRFTYDPQAFALRVGGDGAGVTAILYLGNVFEELQTVTEDRHEAVVQGFVRATLEAQALHRGSLRGKLLPRVRDPAFFSLRDLQLQVELKSATVEVFPQRPLGRELAVALVEDLPDSIRSFTERDLRNRKLLLPEALATAIENLHAMTRRAAEQPLPGVYVSPFRDSHDVSRLLLLDWITAHPVQGDWVAMAVNADTLIFTGSEDVEGLQEMLDLAKMGLMEPRALRMPALRLGAEGWERLQLPQAHPLAGAFGRQQLECDFAQHAQQKELLEVLHERQSLDLFVASFKAVEDGQTGKLVSRTAWTEGVATLLPRADLVSFLPAEGDPKGPGRSPVYQLRWEQAARMLGDRLELHADLVPPRFRAERFPDDGELRRWTSASGDREAAALAHVRSVD